MGQITADYDFVDYKVAKAAFELNPEFDGAKATVDLKVQVHTEVSGDGKRGQVFIDARINREQDPAKRLFSLSLVMVGFFTSKRSVAPAKFDDFLRLNGVASLMPFLRSAIADMTRLANITPCLIPMINVHKLVEKS